MMTNDLIANIPIEKFVSNDGTLVVIWCTNAPSLIAAVLETCLPKWKLKLIATWYWIKVSFYSRFVYRFVFLIFFINFFSRIDNEVWRDNL